MARVYTNCRICAATCGIAVTVEGDRVLRIEPDRDNPHTWRDFCRKGRTAADVVEHPRRLTTPMRRVGDRYVPATYAEAYADIAGRLNAIIARDGPDAVAGYLGNPPSFNSSGPTFFTGLLDAIGTRNRYWIGSIDQNTYHVVAREMYGAEILVLVPDVDDCDFLLLVGMNPAHSKFNWLWNVPDGWRRVQQRQREGAELVVVDPVRTATAAQADVHVAVRPGQDWALLLAMVTVILREGLEHPGDCAAATGMAQLRRLVEQVDLDDLAARCDVPCEQIETLARRFAAARTAMCVTQTGVSHHVGGTVAEWCGQLLNLVTGRLDRPGGRRYEPGYVDIVKLFAAMSTDSAGVSRVRGRPAIAGYHALAELSDEITTPGPGQVRALITYAGNPVVSGPDGGALDTALGTLELHVAIDLVQRESHRRADWLIPGEHFLERSDMLALLGGLQDQAFAQFSPRAVRAPEGVEPEWRFFLDLGLALGRPMFGRRGVNAVVRASRAVARATRRPDLAFGPAWIDRLLVAIGRTVRWRDLQAHPHGFIYRERVYGRLQGALRTPDKRVHAATETLTREAERLLASPHAAAPEGYPFSLGNRRGRHAMNSWLNDTPGLRSRARGNTAAMHPLDAADVGVADGERVVVASPTGEIELPVEVTGDVRRGMVVIGHGWGSRVFDPVGGGAPESLGANRNLLVSRSVVDPLSQIPGLSSSYVSVAPAGG